MSYKISVDAMGGDHGLKTTIPACLSALKKFPDLHICLVGIAKDIEQFLTAHKTPYDTTRLSIVNANEIVEMDESPALALRNKKDSSMRVAINLVKSDDVDACVSAGNTGALMATSKFVLKTLNEIDRPAIVYAIPSLDRKTKKMNPVYMLDLGANVNCSSEQLFQFGIMGSVLAANLKGTERPRVALLNIGEEEMKGLDSIKQAAKMLQNCDHINYIGYVEGNDIFSAKADVIVCDGFAGNIALKTMEGTAKLIADMLKDSFNNSIFSKLAMLISAPVLTGLKRKLDTNQYNGASLLGLRGIVIKSHGSASAEAFETAIYEAIKEIKYNIPQKTQAQIERIMQS
ncbi:MULTISPECIES: phosphate acyltransferase PlsX [Cysteiniphilum]|uniref:phosphate acyltransferase PlsX n=1 Tax=Cysteiniphilum TaxID=2056696 RepID=UPI001783EDBF|nr:phosphate acyltransferase PlsX [Cysteiniphilum marinum]